MSIDPRTIAHSAFAAVLLGCGLLGCGGSRGPGLVFGGTPAGPPDHAIDRQAAGGIVAYSRSVKATDLTVPGTGGITGLVCNPQDEPRSNARITIAAGATSQALDSDDPHAIAAAARTNSRGQYGFANVPPGRWRVRCAKPGGSADMQVVRVRPGGIERCTFGGDRTVAALRVLPRDATLTVGDARWYRAVAHNAAGRLLTGLIVSWRTVDPSIATVTTGGRLRARRAGKTRVRADVDGVSAGTWVTVTKAGGDGLTNLFFLHHSTGDGIIVEGNVRGHIAAYNGSHGTGFEFWDHGYNYEGLRDPLGRWTSTTYSIPGDNTDPDGLHRLWAGSGQAAVKCRNTILANHEVIAFKSCFPASAIPDSRQLSRYKTWYRAMRSFFDTRTDRVFVVMSTPPLHRRSTNRTEAKNARRFANWLRSPQYLDGHPNVVCFDLFNLLAAPDDGGATANMLRYKYEMSHGDGDSHPNSLANQTVGPIFAQALIDAARSH